MSNLIEDYYTYNIHAVLKHCETAILPLRTILYWGGWVWATQIGVVAGIWWACS